jgi:DnaJ domain
MDATGHYAVLGLDASAGPTEIRRAYHRLALLHHPDTNPGDATAAERFLRIAEAYQVLSDPELRASYDAGISGALPVDVAYLVCETDELHVAQNAGLEVVFAFPADGRAFQKPALPGWIVTAGPTVEQVWSKQYSRGPVRETRLHYTFAAVNTGRLRIPACRVFIHGKPVYSDVTEIQVHPVSCMFKSGEQAGPDPARLHLYRVKEIQSGALRKTRVYDRVILIPRSAVASWYHRIGALIAWAFPLIGMGFFGARNWPLLAGIILGMLAAVPFIRSMYALAGVKPLRLTVTHYAEVLDCIREGYTIGLMPPLSRRLAKLTNWLQLWFS